MEKVLVIKINMVPSSKEGLEERTRKSWKVSPKRLDDVKHIIVMHNQVVQEEYTIGDTLVYHLEGELKGRVELQLKEYTEEKTLKGKKIKYLTSNPATIKSYKDLVNLIIEDD